MKLLLGKVLGKVLPTVLRYPTAVILVSLVSLALFQYHTIEKHKKTIESLHIAHAVEVSSLKQTTAQYETWIRAQQTKRIALGNRIQSLETALRKQSAYDRDAVSAVLQENVSRDPVKSLQWLNQQARDLHFGNPK